MMLRRTCGVGMFAQTSKPCSLQRRYVRGTLVKRIPFATVLIALSLSPALSASAAPTEFHVSIPLQFGGHGAGEPERPATPAQIRAEKRLRLARYGLQLADAIVSAIGYRAYARCLSCLAYPGGGPLGSRPVSVANLSGDRPAESDPLIVPFSRGGIGSLALGALAYDLIDARIESDGRSSGAPRPICSKSARTCGVSRRGCRS
jgi:hypothetical protein